MRCTLTQINALQIRLLFFTKLKLNSIVSCCLVSHRTKTAYFYLSISTQCDFLSDDVWGSKTFGGICSRDFSDQNGLKESPTPDATVQTLCINWIIDRSTDWLVDCLRAWLSIDVSIIDWLSIDYRLVDWLSINWWLWTQPRQIKRRQKQSAYSVQAEQLGDDSKWTQKLVLGRASTDKESGSLRLDLGRWFPPRSRKIQSPSPCGHDSVWSAQSGTTTTTTTTTTVFLNDTDFIIFIFYIFFLVWGGGLASSSMSVWPINSLSLVQWDNWTMDASFSEFGEANVVEVCSQLNLNHRLVSFTHQLLPKTTKTTNTNNKQQTQTTNTNNKQTTTNKQRTTTTKNKHKQ